MIAGNHYLEQRNKGKLPDIAGPATVKVGNFSLFDGKPRQHSWA